MNHLNSILLEGFLPAAPLDLSQGQMTMASFLVTSKWFRKGSEEAEFSTFEVEVFGSLARTCLENLKVKSEIRLVGRLVQRYHADDDKRSRVVVVAEHVEFKGPMKVPA